MPDPSNSSQHRWFPGYSVAAVSTVTLAFTAPGQTMLVSLLNMPLRKTFNVEPVWLNGAYAVATVVASLPLVWVGKLIDRFGPRKMLVATALAFGGACLFMSLVANMAMVVVAFFLLRFCGQGSLALAGSHALAMWFHRKLGTVAGFRSVALFLIWALLPTLTLTLFDRFGWRATWAIYGVVVALTVSILSWWLVRDRPEELGLVIDGESLSVPQAPQEPGFELYAAMRTRAYWILAFSMTLPPMIGTAMLFDIQPMMLARDVPIENAAYAVSAWSATMAIMALPSGRLVDKVAPGPVITLGMASIMASCVLLLLAHAATMAVVALSIYAVGQSLVAAAVGTTVARFFGRKHHGAIRSSLTRIGVIGTGLGPLVFGVSHHFTDAYSGGLVVFAVLCLPAMAGALFLRAPST